MVSFEYGNGIQSMDFPSDLTVKTTVSSTGADKALADIIVADIPAGSIMVRATLLLVGRAIENDNATVNRLNIDGTQHIQLRKSGGSYTDTIKLVDMMAEVAANSRDGSFVWFGNIDLTAVEVTGNGTYNVQWEDAEAEQSNLIFHDIQTVLRIYFT